MPAIDPGVKVLVTGADGYHAMWITQKLLDLGYSEGAFDKSLLGVSAVIHSATPQPNAQLEDPEDYIKPAVGSTVGILESALRPPDVKRIIYTSTLGAIAKQVSEPIILSEKDWNDEAVVLVKEQGAKAPYLLKYVASKVLAEKGMESAWDFYEKHKQVASYDFVVLNSPWIFGLAIHELVF
ncbi:hypothetical protein BDQ17DRAFT_1438881 [Cyathus striatus]|nr:hypothetical protein BDQ17DRAFT_1438881 [Cyathus striatus]